MSRVLAVSTAVMLLTAAILAAMAGAADGPPAAEQDFKGKVLAISSRAQSETGTVLEGVRTRQFAGRSFLVGKGIVLDGEENWQQGKTVWVAVDDISQIVEFDSVEEYQKALGSALRLPPNAL